MEPAVQDSRNGKGIFAQRSYAPEAVIYEVTGPFVTCDEDEEMDEAERSNTFRFDEDFYISPKGTIGDFQNHSCEPNAKVIKREGRLFVAAASPIQAGQEILIDYSTIIGEDDVWEMTCNCGSAPCRGTVSSFDRLPAALRRRYIAAGVVPHYIVALSE